MTCAQNVAPAIKFCFGSGDMMLLGLLVLIIFLFGMAIGSGARRKK